MADKASNVVLNFKMSGQVQYAKTIREINAIMNTAAREYKNHIAAMSEDADVTDKLRAEKQKLEIQLEAARKRTEMLRAQYDAMSKSTKTTAGQLAQMYSKLLDSERAEIALQKSLEKVNEGLSEEAQEARKAQQELDKLKKESELLEAEQKQLTSAFKLQTAELGENATEAEKAELAQKQLSDQMELTARIVKNLEQQLDRAKKVYGENSVEVKQLETKINRAKTEIAEFNNKLESIKSSGNKAEQGLDGVNRKLGAIAFLEAAEQLQGIADKLLEIATNASDAALAIADSQTFLQANLGLTAEEAEELNEVVNQVFKYGVVNSIEEAAESVTLVKHAFGDLNNADLEKLTNNITTIAKRTGTDVQENVNAAQKLMMEFGLTGQEAMDLIAAGYQNNLNKAGDFLDTLNEYGPLFADAGFSADQMLQTLITGMEGGAMNTDKVADAVKELQIRFGDGTFEENLDMFSSRTANLFRQWQNGEATMADVMNSIQKDIQKMDTSKQQAALSVLGTQFEDLGIRGTVSLLGIGDGMDDVNGKADEMAQKSPGEKWESSMRELKDALLPLGETLIQIGNDVLPPVVEGLKKLAGWFSDLPGPVKTFITIFGGIIGVAMILVPLLGGLALAFTGLNVALGPLIAIIAGVAAAIAGIILIIQNWGKITDWIAEKIGAMKEKVVGIFTNLKNKVKDIFRTVKDHMVSPIREARDKVREIIDKIKGFFSNLGEKLQIKIPKPKLPHFRIEGKFDLVPPDISVPKLKIDWRAKGAIFTEPTIFGMSGGRLQGAGDAGPEAVLPLNEETLGAIGRGIAATMDFNQSSRPIVLQLEGRTFAQIIGDYYDVEGGIRIRRIERGLA